MDGDHCIEPELGQLIEVDEVVFVDVDYDRLVTRYDDRLERREERVRRYGNSRAEGEPGSPQREHERRRSRRRADRPPALEGGGSTSLELLDGIAEDEVPVHDEPLELRSDGFPRRSVVKANGRDPGVHRDASPSDTGEPPSR